MISINKIILNKKIKYLFITGCIALIGASILYLPYVIKEIPYEFVTIDTRQQNYAFYTEFSRLIENFFKTGELPFYSWSDFLGSNFLVSKIWYVVTDIFMYLGIIFKWYFWDALIYTTIIKMLIAAIGMYLLLLKQNNKPIIAMLGGVAYAFCSSMIYYAVYPHFLAAFCIVPFYLLSLERLLQDDKKILFVLLTSLQLYINFYFFYIVSFFTPFYYLYRYYNVKDDCKRLIKDVLFAITYYFIGVLIAGFILIPIISYMSQNSRIGNLIVSPIFKDINVYFSELAGFLLPTHLFQSYPFPYYTGDYSITETFIWGGNLFLVLLPQLFFSKEKKFSKSSIIIIMFFILFLMSPALMSAMHGFSSVSFRGTFLMVLMIICIGCHILNAPYLINKKALNISSIIIILIIFFLIGASSYLTNGKIVLYEYKDFVSITILSVVSLLIITISLNKLSRHSFLWSVIITVTFSELILFPLYPTHYLKDGSYRHSYQFMKDATTVIEKQPDELRKYLVALEPSNAIEYFRIYVPQESLFWNMGLNMPLIYGIQGVSTYDSVYTPSLNKLVQIAPDIVTGSDWYIDIKNPALLTFLSVKYAIVYESSELPAGMNWELMVDNYLESLSIYRNNNYRSLGSTYEKALTWSDYEHQPSLELLNNYVICEEAEYNEIKSLCGNSNSILENIRYEGNHLFGTVESSDNSFIVLTIPYDSGWKVSINGEKSKVYNVNGGFLGFSVHQGFNAIEMYYTIPGLKDGVYLSIFGFILLLNLIVREFRLIKNEKKEKKINI